MNQLIKRMIVNGYVLASRILHGVGDDVLFISYGGKAYSDNPRAISEALHDRCPEAGISWLIKDPKDAESFPDYVHLVNRQSNCEFFRAIATSRVIVDNSSNIPIVCKSRKQYFIQTWHGDRAFKKIMYDSRTFGKNEVGESIKGFYDLVVSGSDYGDMQYRNAFRYQGEILRVGTPRDDCLIRQDPQRIEGIRKKLGLSDQKVLLYAPTFRKRFKASEAKQTVDNIDIRAVVDLLENNGGSKWVGLLRGHPDIKGITGYREDPSVMDVSGYPDMADLLLIADILITDYSSCAGDFALTKRKLILFQPDLDEYKSQDRDLYFNMEDSPYFTVKNQDELEKAVLSIDGEQAAKNCEEILSFYNATETGKAAETIAEIIARKIGQ